MKHQKVDRKNIGKGYQKLGIVSIISFYFPGMIYTFVILYYTIFTSLLRDTRLQLFILAL